MEISRLQGGRGHLLSQSGLSALESAAGQEEMHIWIPGQKNGGGTKESRVILHWIEAANGPDYKIAVADPELRTNSRTLAAIRRELVHVETIGDDFPSSRTIAEPLMHVASDI